MDADVRAELEALRSQVSRLVDAVEHLSGTGYVEIAFSLEQLLDVLIEHGGSFLHLNVGCPPMLRIGDELVPVGDTFLSASATRYLLRNVLNAERIRLLSQGHEVDFNRPYKENGFRFHVYQEAGCVSASVRPLRTDIPRLVELGLSGGAVEKFLEADEGGLMVLSGKARSGKINTFASLINYINFQRRVRIVTIEPLIQFWHHNEEAAVIQREIGSDSRSFSQAVRLAVQQDPDILAVGSIPDRETAEVVIQAAAGGHLVVATIDATSAIRAVDEMVSAFGGQGRILQLLGRTVKLVVCQHLVGRADGRGLIPAFEILEGSDEVAKAIAAGDSGSLHQVMEHRNMQTLARHLSRMVEVGLVTYDEATRWVPEEDIQVSAPKQLEIKAEALDDDTPLMSWL